MGRVTFQSHAPVDRTGTSRKPLRAWTESRSRSCGSLDPREGRAGSQGEEETERDVQGGALERGGGAGLGGKVACVS